MSNGTVTTGAPRWHAQLAVGESLAGQDLAALLGGVQDRIETIIAGTRERMNALMKSVMAVSDGLDLDETLRQITLAAIELVDARYGALGVLADDGTISQFIFLESAEGSESPLNAVIADVAGRGRARGDGDGGPPIEDAQQMLLADLKANPLSAGFAAYDPSTRRALGVPVFARGKVFGRLYLTEKHLGAGLTEDDEIVVRALAGAAGIAIDNSRLYAKAQRHRRWSEATAEVTSKLLSGGDAGEVVQLIARHAMELTDADYALIALPDDPATPAPKVVALTVTVCVGTGSEDIVGRTIPISGSTAGEVFADHIPRNVEALSYDLAEGLGVEFGPALALPLGMGDSLAGVLLAVRIPGRRPFDDLEMQMVALFAAQTMLALERVEIEATKRELQVLAERDRIARDLHDHVIQRLFAVGLAMESTLESSKVPTVSDRLEDHVEQVYAVIAEIRTAIFDLQTSTGADFQLRTTVKGAITELTADSGIRTTVRMAGALDALPTDLIPHVLAVVREGVSNVVRHADAKNMTVTISVNSDVLAIDVTDDGIGIPDTVAQSGLHNLDQRARAADGTCQVRRGEHEGTRLTWSAPLTNRS